MFDQVIDHPPESDGCLLSQKFERRYAALPWVDTELIRGTVYVAFPFRARQLNPLKLENLPSCAKLGEKPDELAETDG